jgi:hypothetical protein
MSPRAWYWLLGLLAVALLSSVIPWPAESERLGPFLLFCLLVAIGMVGEVVGIVRSVRAPARRAAPADARPADGEVGIAAVAGVAGEPNARDPRFRRFLRVEPAAEAPSPWPAAAGDTPPLLGRVVLVSMFLGQEGAGWSDDEVAAAHKALLRAGGWIEREAIRWGVAVNIELADTYFAAEAAIREEVEVEFAPEWDHFAPVEAGRVAKVLADASRAAARLGFADVADLIARIDPRLRADERVWLLHLRRAGQSIAVGEADSGLPGVNLAVCYAREANLPERLAGPPFADPVTFVHELLHLFGATDKYDRPLRSFPRGSVTERDVMRLDVESLPRLRIDPLTAAEIGWTGAFDPESPRSRPS